MRKRRKNGIQNLQQTHGIVEINFNGINIPFNHWLINVHKKFCKNLVDDRQKAKTFFKA